MFVDANAVRHHVQRMGSGPPLVMAHGLIVGSLASWYFTAAGALARSRTVWLYDLRGHGLSERAPVGYDLATLSADLAALTEEIAEPLALAGHSYGALVCLRYALDHPGRVTRLVLVEPPLPPSQFGQFPEFLRRTPEEMLAALPPAMSDFVEQGGRRARRFIESLRFLLMESSLRADVEAEADIDDAELAKLACPALVVYGTRSACRPCGDRLQRVLPRVELEVLDGGHFLHLDAPTELSARMESFLDG